MQVALVAVRLALPPTDVHLVIQATHFKRKGLETRFNLVLSARNSALNAWGTQMTAYNALMDSILKGGPVSLMLNTKYF